MLTLLTQRSRLYPLQLHLRGVVWRCRSDNSGLLGLEVCMTHVATVTILMRRWNLKDITHARIFANDGFTVSKDEPLGGFLPRKKIVWDWGLGLGVSSLFFGIPSSEWIRMLCDIALTLSIRNLYKESTCDSQLLWGSRFCRYFVL